MPTLRCGKMYESSRELQSQVTVSSQNAIPINISSRNPSPKITATGESLFSIHKKIQRHLTGTKLLTKFEVRKLMLILNRMHCSSPTEHEIMVTAQNILSQVYRRIISESTAGQYENDASLKDEEDSTGLMDSSSLEKYETLCNAISNVVTNNSNSDNNISSPFPLNNEMSQNFCQGSDDILIGETGNGQVNSQSSDIIKLRLNGAEAYDQNDGSLSFPLELLTNNDFVISQKNGNSDLIYQNDTCTGRKSIPNTENVHLYNQLKDTSDVDNNSAFNENTPYDERMVIDNNTQVNLQSNEYSYKVNPEISSSEIPESNNQIKVDGRVSKNKAFEINAKDILTISSFTTNTPPQSFEAFEKMMSIANTTIPSDRTKLNESNFTDNIPLSAQTVHKESSNIEDPSQLTAVEYKNETPQITGTRKKMRLEGAIWENEDIGISQATEYDLSDSKSPEIIFTDSQRKNSMDDDVEITDADGTFCNAQSQAIKSAEYSRLTFPDSQNKISIYDAVIYDSSHLNSSAPALQENNSIISNLQKIDKENRNKSDLPRDKFELKSARQNFANTNDVLPVPSECNLDTDTIILGPKAADDAAVITNGAIEVQDNDVRTRTLNQSENESFVFNLERIDSAIDIIEATPSSKFKQIPSLKLQTRKSATLMDNIETEDIIIDETDYTKSESAIFQTNSFKKYGISCPYRSQTQSNSFLNYKSQAKSSRCISSRRTDSGMASSIGGPLNLAEAQSNNMLMINGEIPKRGDRMESTEEESFSEKQAKLQKKVMRKRDIYRAQWKDIPVTEKISSKFIQKFHVRIFEDPVNSLTNIDYKPNFNNFHFMRLTINEINEEMKSSWEMSKKIDDALTKAVSGVQERSTKDWASAFFKNTATELDSDSSDEENKANNKWLIEYIQKAKYQTTAFDDEAHKEIGNVESERRNTWDNGTPGNDEDRAEQLENLFKKLGEFDWFIE